MRTVIAVFFLMTVTSLAVELTGAQAELNEARTALDEGRFRDVFEHAGRVQVLYYRDADAVAEALYYEALANYKTGGLTARVSALAELEALYSDSIWCRKAQAEIKEDETE